MSKHYIVPKYEPYGKNMKLAFGVLKSWFTIIRGAAQSLKDNICMSCDNMHCYDLCIIMHNMIVKEEHNG